MKKVVLISLASLVCLMFASDAAARVDYKIDGEWAQIHIDSDNDWDDHPAVDHNIGSDGTAAHPWVIHGWNVNAEGGNYAILIEDTDDYFIISGVYTYGATYMSWDSSGIWIRYTGAGTARIDNSYGTVYSYFNGVGIQLESVSGAYIQYAWCKYNYWGYQLDSTLTSTIEGGRTRYSVSAGIRLMNDCAYNTIDGVEVRGDSSANDGIIIYSDCFENLVVDCDVSLFPGDGIRINGDDNLVKGNTIVDNDEWGVKLTSAASGNRVWSNDFTRNSGDDPQACDAGTDNDFTGYCYYGYPWGSCYKGNYWNDHPGGSKVYDLACGAWKWSTDYDIDDCSGGSDNTDTMPMVSEIN